MRVEKIIKTNDEWKLELTSAQYNVCREESTEPPFSREYLNCKDEGIYRCICCDNDLFSSDTKFDSGTGWPSFGEEIKTGNVIEKGDTTMGMMRVEIKCNRCDSHLGHVFNDGPAPSHKRYCVNSISLKLVKKS